MERADTRRLPCTVLLLPEERVVGLHCIGPYSDEMLQVRCCLWDSVTPDAIDVAIAHAAAAL
jgi:hypothetical protein